MDNIPVCMCSYGCMLAAISVEATTSYYSFVDEVCSKFKILQRETVKFSYSVGNFLGVILESDGDFRHMSICWKKSNSDFIEIKVEDCNCLGSEVFEIEDDLVDIENSLSLNSFDVIDEYLVESTSSKSNLILSNSWANGIIEVGQKFEGAAKEFRIVLRKYALET